MSWKGLLLCLCLLIYQDQFAQSPFSFAVHFSGDREAVDSMQIYLYSNFISAAALPEKGYIKAGFKKNETQRLISQQLVPNARLSLYAPDLNSSDDVLNNLWVEPGDSITMLVNGQKDKWNISFSGRGASRYNLALKLDSLYHAMVNVTDGYNNNELHATSAWDKIHQITDLQLKLWKSYKRSLSSTAYQIGKADIIGNSKTQLLTIGSRAYSLSIGEEKVKWKKQLLKETDAQQQLSPEVIIRSQPFIRYLAARTKWQLLMEHNPLYIAWELKGTTHSFRFIDYYKKIKSTFQGTLREAMITYVCSQSLELITYFNGCGPQEYTYVLHDAMQSVSNPMYKEKLTFRWQHQGSGNPAFNFSFQDQNNNKVTLSDLRGNIVLVNVWSEGCTACASFKKEMDKSIYTLFKERSDFRVVAVSTQKNTTRWKKAINKYSHPDFINLQMNQEEETLFRNWYENAYVPFILLIDREGRIVSVTTRERTKLEELIRQELNASSKR